jgi:hypothetical protein
MSNLVLHFGLPKTGTTTLQRTLFHHHSEVFYLGKYVPSDTRKGCLSEQVYRWLEPLLWKTDSVINIDQHRAEYARIREQARPGEHVTVCSWESLGMSENTLFRKRLERIISVCGDVKLQMTLRNPLTWLPSSYLQELQGNFTKRKADIFGRRAFMAFDDWLSFHQRRRGSLAGWLDYAGNIRSAAQMLGKSNVSISLFEDLVSDPERFYRSIADFLEIDSRESLELAASHHYNTRLSKSDVKYMQAVNSSLPSRLRWLLSSARKRRSRMPTVSDSAISVSEPARVSLSASWQQKVAEATREGHHLLAREFGLELERHGYPF